MMECGYVCIHISFGRRPCSLFDPRRRRLRVDMSGRFLAPTPTGLSDDGEGVKSDAPLRGGEDDFSPFAKNTAANF
jgi:hypothetical protein